MLRELKLERVDLQNKVITNQKNILPRPIY